MLESCVQLQAAFIKKRKEKGKVKNLFSYYSHLLLEDAEDEWLDKMVLTSPAINTIFKYFYIGFQHLSVEKYQSKATYPAGGF